MLNTLFLMHLMLSVAVYGLFCLEKGHLLFIMAYIYKNRQALACLFLYISISILFFALVEVVQVAFKYLLYTHLHFVSFHIE